MAKGLWAGMACGEGRGGAGAVDQLCPHTKTVAAHVSSNFLISTFQLRHTEDFSHFKVVRLTLDCPVQKLNRELKVGLSEKSVRLIYRVSTATILVASVVHTEQTSYIHRF